MNSSKCDGCLFSENRCKTCRGYSGFVDKKLVSTPNMALLSLDEFISMSNENKKLRAENELLKEAINNAIDTILLIPGSSEPETWAENAREILERALKPTSSSPGHRHVCLKCGLPWSDSAGAQRCPRCNSEIPDGAGVIK